MDCEFRSSSIWISWRGVVVVALLCSSIDSKRENKRNNQPEDNFADINNCTQTHPSRKIQLYLFKHKHLSCLSKHSQTVIEIQLLIITKRGISKPLASKQIQTSVVNSGRSRRYRGAERQKTAYRVRALPSRALGKSGSIAGFAAAIRWCGADQQRVEAPTLRVRAQNKEKRAKRLCFQPILAM